MDSQDSVPSNSSVFSSGRGSRISFPDVFDSPPLILSMAETVPLQTNSVEASTLARLDSIHSPGAVSETIRSAPWIRRTLLAGLRGKRSFLN